MFLEQNLIWLYIFSCKKQRKTNELNGSSSNESNLTNDNTVKSNNHYFPSFSIGFRDFSEEDQYNIVRLGQSKSCFSHWYRREKHDFDYFLSWKPANAVREFKFKESCLKFSEMIASQDWDMIESAIMNSLVMIATGK